MPFFGFVFRSQEPRAADWNLDRFPFSTEPKIPIGARKLALPVLSTQESSAVAPKQKREGRERKEKKSRSFDCKRSFSFAEISHGCRNRKGSLCTYVYNQPCAAVSQD
jgi:hypothetical protein